MGSKCGKKAGNQASSPAGIKALKKYLRDREIREAKLLLEKEDELSRLEGQDRLRMTEVTSWRDEWLR